MLGYVYKISSQLDDRIYIGSTINLNKRWNEHKRDLLNKKHQNLHLQRFVNKYGITQLCFEILECIDTDNILLREQFYIDNSSNLFNISLNASAPMMGKKHSFEAINKISLKTSGVNNPMYGKKRPKWLIELLTKNSIGREKNREEKIKRMINLPNRKELIIEKNNFKHICFSISHAAKIIGVTQQSISSALKDQKKSKGWTIKKSDMNFYNQSVLLKNLHLFDENCHPQPELTKMLKSLA